MFCFFFFLPFFCGLISKDVSEDDARGIQDTEPSTAGSSCGFTTPVTTPTCFELEAGHTKLLTDAALNSITQCTKALDFEGQTNEAGN